MIHFEVTNLDIEKIKNKYILKINDDITRCNFKKELSELLKFDVISNDINNDDFILSKNGLIASFKINENIYHIIVCNHIRKIEIFNYLQEINFTTGL